VNATLIAAPSNQEQRREAEYRDSQAQERQSMVSPLRGRLRLRDEGSHRDRQGLWSAPLVVTTVANLHNLKMWSHQVD